MSRGTILYIDREQAQLPPVTDALADRGYRVIRVQNESEAVAAAANEKPRLVVLNAVGPTADAHRMCRQLKACPSTCHIRVLMLTGRPTEADTFWGMKQGADAYLAEPFAGDDLVNRVNRLI